MGTVSSRARAFIIIVALIIAFPPQANAAGVAKTATTRSAVISASGVVAGPEAEFLPVCVWNGPVAAADVSYMKSLGINTILGSASDASSDQELLDAARLHGMHAILNYNEQVRYHPSLAGWLLAFEPDNNGETTESVQMRYDALRTSDSVHPTVVNLQNGFFSDASFNYIPDALAGSRSAYGSYVKSTDIVGVDVFPLNRWARSDWLYLPGASLDMLKSNYTNGEKPAWALVEASDQNLTTASAGVRGPTPEEVRFQAWDSVLHGATGLAYCVRAYSPDRLKNLTTAVEDELRRTNGEILALKDVILARPALEGVTAAEANARPVKFIARKNGARCYIIAANEDMARNPETITFTLPRGVASVQAFGERRYLTPSGNSFTDEFAPLAVKAYEVNFFPPNPGGKDYYVSPAGANGDGSSWAQAWNELDQIDWGAIQPGDVIHLDGGTDGTTYTTNLTTGKGGTSRDLPITIRRSEEPGHNGTVTILRQIRLYNPYVTFDGGRPDKFRINATDTMCTVFVGYWGVDATGCELRNVALIGTYATISGVSASVYAPDCVVHGCDFERSAGEDPLAVMTGGNITVEECHFYGLVGAQSDLCHRDAISTFPGTTIGHVFTLRNNLFEDNRTDNFTVFPTEGTVVGGFEIWGNTFRFCNTAIHFDDRVATAEFINVYNNRFEDVNVPVHNASTFVIDWRPYNADVESGLPTPTPFPTPFPTPTPSETPTPDPESTPSPSVPVANAGDDIEVYEGMSFTLSGSDSYDWSGAALTYTWTQVDGRPFRVQRTVDADITMTAPSVNADTTATFQLTVSNGYAEASDSVVVTVYDSQGHPRGLVAEYQMDDMYLDKIKDSSGNENTGIVQGAVLEEDGRFGKALRFDGVDDMVVVASNPTLDTVEGLTIEAWVKPSSVTDGWSSIVSREKWQGTAYALYAASNLGGPTSVIWSKYEEVLGSTSVLPTDSWTYLVSTYDDYWHRLYLNGVLVAVHAVGGPIVKSNFDLIIGGSWPSGNHFAGLIDNVRVYNRALLPKEIQRDMTKAPQELLRADSAWMLYR